MCVPFFIIVFAIIIIIIRECEVINQADDDDTIYRVVTPSVRKGGKDQDFIMLASRRRPCDPRWGILRKALLLIFPLAL